MKPPQGWVEEVLSSKPIERGDFKMKWAVDREGRRRVIRRILLVGEESDDVEEDEEGKKE